MWETQTSRDADGWTVELWIPFAQLWFSPESEQVWGLNMRWFRPVLDEEDYWVPTPRTERFWSSRFGEPHGISGIRPTKRVELLPYVAGASTFNANRDLRNPFDDGKNLKGRGGSGCKDGSWPKLDAQPNRES